ncbi:BREX-1 system adenine-specific DNA-methyltransferase PglX [Aeromonas sp. QDB05]|uniref:BREX-1 system adenine-specific DNA-methyltransferase PglX n=1 Tax=Aeromonas sp. QDB05 TaxID=2990478 RepID=UPI0022E47C1C|nr:BREX-1 system adenine-specific DNA-methyltransferase PglX [Aeromonas sp. QDB05]
MSQQENNNMQKHFYRASATDLGKIPDCPIAYWLPSSARQAFSSGFLLDDIAPCRAGMQTGENDKFVRFWFEINFGEFSYSSLSKADAEKSMKKWFPYNSGGGYRKWYGNNEKVVDWYQDGINIKKDKLDKLEKGLCLPSNSKPKNEQFYFLESITWTAISSSFFGVRVSNKGHLFDIAGASSFPSETDFCTVAGFLISKLATYFLSALNPTLNVQPGNIGTLPFNREVLACNKSKIDFIVKNGVDLCRNDWNSYESSWEFTGSPILRLSQSQLKLKSSFQKLRIYWRAMVQEMQRLEEENNRHFINAYGLQDELTPEVSLSEITLTCNPHYRYGGNLTDEEREARLQSDTIAELISYAIGCMMGRYSLDREGLVYAHAGNQGFKALVEEGAYATFATDEDGILPLTSDNWFPDDVAARIEQFVRTVWDAETLEENLQFIADSLCLAAIKPVKKGGETARETIRRYLSTQFFKDHLKTYKKRPIYWLFSSGKEKAFECLVYLHRYNESTLPRMRTEYVTPLLGQMAGRIERLRLQQAEAGTAEAKRIGKEIDTLSKQLTELRAFDDELKHHADMRITLDLDDGVKVNYGKFGNLLSEVKAITGDKGE